MLLHVVITTLDNKYYGLIIIGSIESTLMYSTLSVQCNLDYPDTFVQGTHAVMPDKWGLLESGYLRLHCSTFLQATPTLQTVSVTCIACIQIIMRMN